MLSTFAKCVDVYITYWWLAAMAALNGIHRLDSILAVSTCSGHSALYVSKVGVSGRHMIPGLYNDRLVAFKPMRLDYLTRAHAKPSRSFES